MCQPDQIASGIGHTRTACLGEYACIRSVFQLGEHFEKIFARRVFIEFVKTAFEIRQRMFDPTQKRDGLTDALHEERIQMVHDIDRMTGQHQVSGMGPKRGGNKVEFAGFRHGIFGNEGSPVNDYDLGFGFMAAVQLPGGKPVCSGRNEKGDEDGNGQYGKVHEYHLPVKFVDRNKDDGLVAI